MSGYEPANYIPDEEKNNEQIKKYNKQIEKESYLYDLYLITHLIISFFAIYLSWRCNNGFHILAFLAALCCPYLYIIWALATNGGCGIFDNSQPVSNPTYNPNPNPTMYNNLPVVSYRYY